MPITRRNIVASHPFPDSFASRIQKNRSLFAAVRWGRSQATCLWGKTPFLYVGFNEDESHLSEVDMYLTRSLSANRGKEVLSLESMRNIVEFLAVTGEEDCSCARSVTNSNNIALDVGRSVSRGCEGLVVAPIAVGSVRN